MVSCQCAPTEVLVASPPSTVSTNSAIGPSGVVSRELPPLRQLDVGARWLTGPESCAQRQPPDRRVASGRPC